MTFGLPTDLFIRELSVVVAYGAAAVVCSMRWQQGLWARVGACAAAVGAAVTAFSLISWALNFNGAPALWEFRTRDVVEDLLGWLDVLALVGVLVAILLNRSARPDRPAPQSATADQATAAS